MKRPRLGSKGAILRSLLPLLVLFLLPLILFGPVTFGSRTLLPLDNLFEFEPYRSAAGELGVDQPHNALLSDLTLQNYAWKRFIVQSIQARQLPLWNPYLFGGVTFLANGHHSALYPLSVIYYAVPLWRAYGLFTIVQLGLAGVFMYIFARVLGISRLGATIAGMTFQASGFFVVSVVHPMIIAAAAWLPLILAAIELVIQQRPLFGRPATAPWVLLGALALGCSVLAGHAEILYFALLVAAFYTTWRLIYQFTNPTPLRSGDYSPQSTNLPGDGKLVRPVGWIATMVLLGLMVGAIQLVPSIEVVNGSFREGRASLSQVLGWAYPVRRVLTFFVPNFFGNPAHHDYFDLFTGQMVQSPTPIDWGIKNYVEGGAYLGLLPLFLAALAILSQFTNLPIPLRSTPGTIASNPQASGIQKLGTRVFGLLRQPHIPLFLALALFALACMFGTPLYTLVYVLPKMGQSHSPFRWVFPFTLSVAVLAGFGVDILRRTRQEPKIASHDTLPVQRYGSRFTHYVLRPFFLDAPPSLITLFAALAFWGGLLLTTGLLASRLFFEQLEPTVTRIFHSLAKADTAFPDVRAFYSYEFRWVLIASLLLMGAGIVLRVSRCPIYLPHLSPSPPTGGIEGGRRRRPVWEVLAIGLLALDLFTFGYGFHSAADPALLDYVPPVVQFLKQDEGHWRFTTFDPTGLKTLNPNMAWLHDLEDIRGYDSLFSAQYRDYMRLIDEQDELDYNLISPLRNWSGLDSPLLDLLNVKYVLTEERDVRLDESPKYRLVYEDKALRVYENLGVMPRAYHINYACTTASDDPLAAMQTTDPRATVIVHSRDLPAPLARSGDTACTPEPAQSITYDGPNQVFVDVAADMDSWLVLADSYFPGWKAFARPLGGTEEDESELKVVRVAGNFRGVALEPGTWTVRFKYSPDAVKIGAFFSFLAGIICLFLAGAWAWRFFYREEDDASTARRVAKNSIAPIVVNLMNRAVEMGFAALMARILGPVGNGRYFTAILVYGWFDTIANFGLEMYLMREVARDRDNARQLFVNTTVLRLLLFVAVMPVLGGFLAGRQALGEPLADETVWAVLLLYVGLLPSTVANSLTGLFRGCEKHEYPAAIQTVTTIIRVTLGVLVLMGGLGIVGLAGATILTNVATMTILAVLAQRLIWADLPRARGRIVWPLQREMLAASWPLMSALLLQLLFTGLNGVLLQFYRGDEVAGWYDAARKWVDAPNLIPAIFTFAVFPLMSRQATQDRSGLRRSYRLSVKLLTMVAMPLAVLFTLLATTLVGLLSGEKFLPHGATALQILIWSIVFGWINSLTNYVLIALDRQRYVLWASGARVIFTVAANALFVERFSYAASAWIILGGELLLLLLFYADLSHHLGAIKWGSLLWRPALAALLMGVVVWGASSFSLAAALLAGMVVYPVAVIFLHVFTPEEWALLAPLLPGPLRRVTGGVAPGKIPGG